MYKVDDDFFDIESHEKYWLIGLIASDGSIGKYNQIVLSQSGEEGLNRINYVKRLLNSNYPINAKQTSGEIAYIFQISSVKMVRQLEGYNIVRNKTLIYTFPVIPEKYLCSFLAGYIEGDGCITVSHNKDNVEYLSVSFVGTKEFIMSCNEMLPVKGAIRKHNLSSVYEIRWYGKKAVNFCKWLFQYPELYHGIKYANYLYGKNIVEKSRDAKYSKIKEIVLNDFLNENVNVVNYAKSINIPFQTLYKWKKEWKLGGRL